MTLARCQRKIQYNQLVDDDQYSTVGRNTNLKTCTSDEGRFGFKNLSTRYRHAFDLGLLMIAKGLA